MKNALQFIVSTSADLYELNGVPAGTNNQLARVMKLINPDIVLNDSQCEELEELIRTTALEGRLTPAFRLQLATYINTCSTSSGS